MEFLTDTSDTFVLHGRTGAGVAFAFDYDLYADDAASLGESRPDLSLDMAALCPHFVRFAMNVHQGQDGKKSKSEFMFFARQASVHENARLSPGNWNPSTAEEFSRERDFIDLPPTTHHRSHQTCLCDLHQPFLLPGRTDGCDLERPPGRE
jgi:hypothetical protein